MLDVRIPTDEEVPKLEAFLNKHLRPTEKWSIKDEFPIAFQKNNHENIRVVTDENENILAHAVIKYLYTKSTFGLFKVACIGSVVTDPQSRNKGLSRQILENCIQTATDAKCDFAILWTNLYDFYRKLDFELAGSEIGFTIKQDLKISDDPLKFMKTNKVSPDDILKLYLKHTVGALRTPSTLKTYLTIPNSQLYTAWSPNGQLQAYCVEGRGADLKGYLHEWGGGISKILPLLNYVRSDIKRDLTLIVPAHSQNLISQLKEQKIPFHEGFLGMIKPLNYDLLFGKIRRYTNSIGEGKFLIEKTKQGFVFGDGTNVYKTDNPRDITRLIFGPHKASKIFPFDKEFCNQLEKIFPIPMWIWGWDSV